MGRSKREVVQGSVQMHARRLTRGKWTDLGEDSESSDSSEYDSAKETPPMAVMSSCSEYSDERSKKYVEEKKVDVAKSINKSKLYKHAESDSDSNDSDFDVKSFDLFRTATKTSNGGRLPFYVEAEEFFDNGDMSNQKKKENKIPRSPPMHGFLRKDIGRRSLRKADSNSSSLAGQAVVNQRRSSSPGVQTNNNPVPSPAVAVSRSTSALAIPLASSFSSQSTLLQANPMASSFARRSDQIKTPKPGEFQHLLKTDESSCARERKILLNDDTHSSDASDVEEEVDVEAVKTKSKAQPEMMSLMDLPIKHLLFLAVALLLILIALAIACLSVCGGRSRSASDT